MHLYQAMYAVMVDILWIFKSFLVLKTL